jgi:hypothetical protein
MSSSITWLDHDSSARERSMRLLSSFTHPESRDELGIAGIRDSIADQLFPGTSTIQTRLRYVFFIPWLFLQLEERRVAASSFPAAARKAELQLVAALIDNLPQDTSGVIGRESRETLKRMPSSVYWTALGSWGLRGFQGSLQQYFNQVDQLYAARSARRRRDDGDLHDSDSSGQVWHPKLLQLCSGDFPNDVDFNITRKEAEFLLDRWRNTHPDSLLSWLAVDCSARPHIESVERIWLHPRLAEFPAPMQLLINHGHRFDTLIGGAALLYNLLLAQLAQREELVSEYETRLGAWETQDAGVLLNWNLDEFWPLVIGQGHSITQRTKEFVRQWLQVVASKRGGIVSSAEARQIIENRERALKEGAGKSRFTNRTALAQWGGSAGLVPLNYRWPIAQAYLIEWHQGWSRNDRH